jgi:flagellar protein FliL
MRNTTLSDSAKKAAPEKAAKGGGSPMMPIMMGIMLLAVLAIGAKVFMGGGGAKAQAKGVKKPAEVGVSLPLDEFLVNLSGTSDHYLKTTMALGLKKGLTEEQAKEHIPAMRDAILSVLQTKSMKELNTPKDRDALKDEVKERVNKEVPDEPVVKVYFTSFATQ